MGQMQIQIRCDRTRHLIRRLHCSKIIFYKKSNDNKKKRYHQQHNPKIRNILIWITRFGKSIRFKWVNGIWACKICLIIQGQQLLSLQQGAFVPHHSVSFPFALFLSLNFLFFSSLFLSLKYFLWAAIASSVSLSLASRRLTSLGENIASVYGSTKEMNIFI